MKKFICLILMVVVFPLFAQNTYKTIETFNEYETFITLCLSKNKGYVLINNSYNVFPEYLIVFDDDNYPAKRCYGEFLLAYYYIKHKNKEYKYYNGIRYEVIMDNTNEEIAFLRALTDSFVLQDYPTFFFIDKNSSKKEAIEFYDNFEGENKEDEIGSSAGVLMGIKASDFIDMLQEIKE